MKSIRKLIIISDVLKALGIVVVLYLLWLHVYVVRQKYVKQKLEDLTLLSDLYKQESVLDEQLNIVKQFINVQSSTSLLKLQNQRMELEKENIELLSKGDNNGEDKDPEKQQPPDGEPEEKGIIGEESLPLFRKVHRNDNNGVDGAENAEDNDTDTEDTDVFNSATVLLPHLSRFIPTLDNIGSRYPTLNALKGAINRADMEIKALDSNSNNANANSGNTTMEAWQDLAIIFDEQYEMLQSINFYDMLSSCPTTNDDDDSDEHQQQKQPPSEEDIKQLNEHAKQLEEEIVQSMVESYHHHDTNTTDTDDTDDTYTPDDWPVVLDDSNDRIDKILMRTIDSAKSNARTSIQE